MNGCDWHILAGNDERINSHCLTHAVSVICSFSIEGDVVNVVSNLQDDDMPVSTNSVPRNTFSGFRVAPA